MNSFAAAAKTGHNLLLNKLSVTLNIQMCFISPSEAASIVVEW